MALNWHVARTKPLAEYTAAGRLKSAGVEVFLPCLDTAHPGAGHSSAPLFPGYLFLRYDLERWGWPRLLLRNANIIELVAFGGVVAQVDDAIITELARRVEAVNQSSQFRTLVRTGDRVRVRLRDTEERLVGVVAEAMPESARVRVLLEFLGLQVPVDVARGDVQPAIVGGSNPAGPSRPPRRTRGGGRWIQGFGSRATSKA